VGCAHRRYSAEQRLGAEDQNTPLQIGDTLYVCTPYSKVLALDVDSGKEKWRYDSKATAPNWQRCRGLGYFEDHPT
jgi:quinate dehydrogenase (quinone)